MDLEERESEGETEEVEGGEAVDILYERRTNKNNKSFQDKIETEKTFSIL